MPSLSVKDTALSNTATENRDYTHLATDETVTASDWGVSGQAFTQTETFTVRTTEDTDHESAEQFFFNIQPTAGQLYVPTCPLQHVVNTNECQAVVTLNDDDALSVTDASITSAPATGTTYGSAETISITATFNGAVTVTGMPRIAFDLGGATRHAGYTGGSDTRELVFSYLVADGDNDSNGISWGANGLDLNGGTIKFVSAESAEQVDAARVLTVRTDASGHKVDTKPVLVSATVTGTTLTLTYSEPLKTTPTPAVGDFAVSADGNAVTVTGVSVTGRTVVLTLMTAVTPSQTVTVSYTKGTNKIQDAGGTDADALSSRSVDDITNDTTAPTVTKIERQTPSSSPTNADSLTWRVTFSEDVKNVDSAGTDFEVSNTTAMLAAAAVSSSSSVYDVTASGGNLTDLDATVTLDFASGQNIADNANNALSTATTPSPNENTYVLDNTAPTVTITNVPPTSTAAFPATFTFNEEVTGFALDDITVGNGEASSLQNTSGDNKTFTAQITPTADGAVTVDVAVDAATDAAGNGNTVATQVSSAYTAPTTTASTVLGALVSNTGQSTTSQSTVGRQQAQPFTTGTNTAGYRLTGVGIYNTSVNTVIGVLVRIAPSAGGGGPDLSTSATLITLTNPSTINSNAINTYSASTDTTLAANTTYPCRHHRCERDRVRPGRPDTLRCGRHRCRRRLEHRQHKIHSTRP